MRSRVTAGAARLLLGPAACLAALAAGETSAARMAGVAAWMAVWWIAEAVPLAVTALLPLVLFPLVGIQSGRDTAPLYVNSIIFLFLGGFLIALAMERWGLHRRIALAVIRRIGGGPSRLVLDRWILSVDVFRKVPWEVVLLFGGGFALAQGFRTSGLSADLGEQAAVLQGAPILATIAAVCGMLTFLTELTANTATTEMILPILASVARAMRIDPLLLMIPATLSASCAFMMPVATPPNAIVFAGGRVRVVEMVRVGLVLNLVGVVIIALGFYFLGTAVLGVDPAVTPPWAVE